MIKKNLQDINLSNVCSKFAGQIVSIYSVTIGNWAGVVMAVAVFITLFSTTLTIIDAYPRSIVVSYHLLFGKNKNSEVGNRLDAKDKSDLNKKTYILSCLYGVLSLIIIMYFSKNLKTIIDIAAIIAFLSTPIFAYMNYKLIYNKRIFEYYKPGIIITFLSRIGLVYLSGFAILYIYYFVL